MEYTKGRCCPLDMKRNRRKPVQLDKLMRGEQTMLYISDILGAIAVTSLWTSSILADCGKPVIPAALFLLAIAAGAGWYRESGERARDRRKHGKE